MSFFILMLLGFLGGIPAGMGMGGGTLTIPLLIIIGGVEQKIAQSANLFAFLPMSVGALKMHSDNNLLKTDGIFWIICPAFLFSLIGVSVAALLPSAILTKAFGVFLVGLGIVSFYREIKGKKKW